MDYLLVIDHASGESKLMSLERASAFTGIAAEEIDTSVADACCCNSMDFLIIDTRPADEVTAAG
jgi:hypothetical protein